MKTRPVSMAVLFSLAASAQPTAAAKRPAEARAPQSSLELITETDSLWVQSNDFWDDTELFALFYFRARDVLDLLQAKCPSKSNRPAAPEHEVGFSPWLMQICRRPGAHAYPGEGGLRDPAGMMRDLVTRGMPGLVCCGHRTFAEFGVPDNFQLARTEGRWKCNEGELVPLEKIERGVGGLLRCQGRVIWPHSVGR